MQPHFLSKIFGGSRDAAASVILAKLRKRLGKIEAKFGEKWLDLGKVWFDLGKIKILHLQTHSISYGYVYIPFVFSSWYYVDFSVSVHFLEIWRHFIRPKTLLCFRVRVSGNTFLLSNFRKCVMFSSKCMVDPYFSRTRS